MADRSEGSSTASRSLPSVCNQPALGVRSLRPLKLLRYALLAKGYFAPWAELVERVAREPSQPRKNHVNDEAFQRFYTVPTVTTARDRLLLALKGYHPEYAPSRNAGSLVACLDQFLQPFDGFPRFRLTSFP
jgi:hypothetical protein